VTEVGKRVEARLPSDCLTREGWGKKRKVAVVKAAATTTTRNVFSGFRVRTRSDCETGCGFDLVEVRHR
jgi:hypothetical protein